MNINKPWFGLCGLSLCGLLAIGSATAQATTLQDILKDALVHDPAMREAKANTAVAHNNMQMTKAGHYPVMSVMGTQILGQQHKFESNAQETHFAPGVKATLNVFAWGGIEAAVDRDKEKERYYQHRQDQTREEVGDKIGKLYLTALRAKESLVVAQRNLQRHDKIIQDLSEIVVHDPGRRSELVQAQARRLRVDTNIAEVRRSMGLALSRLAAYTGKPLRPEVISDPFLTISAHELVTRYRNEDAKQTPNYQAQLAERESARADVRASKAARMPAINIEGAATRDNKEVYLRVSWDVFNQASRYSVSQKAESLIAAESRMEQVLRDVTERSRTAEFDMAQNEHRANLASEYITAQKEVVWSYEQQFKIARRTLIDVLDAYNELAGIEENEVAARNDFRDAALEYLLAQAQIAMWAGVPNE
ncbi:MAG: TolC family protein [Neisseriaceae bacterium]|nr:TolC family protein [Neisseriaceae bacterium]